MFASLSEKHTAHITLLVFSLTFRLGAHQGNWQPQRNRDFREVLSATVEQMLINWAAQIEENATQLAGRLRNSFSRQWSMSVFTTIELL
jgi:hypothetical protein